MTRRFLLATATSVAAAGSAPFAQAASAGRLKQSAARWCYSKMSLDDLCRNGARIGLSGIDLVSYDEWPTVQKYGLVPAMTPGAGTIPNAWNRKENHGALIKEMQENIPRAAAAKVPNVITFSGNRRGMPDDEAKDNCVAGLNQVKKIAEDNNVTICLELLNSKVNHKDYQCDHTAWGVDVIRRVDSPRVKLLYDIYHMQIMEGDIIRTIRENIQYIAHFHTGGVPGRHELDDTQELNWHAIAAAIADLKFQGFMAHEFIPTRDPMTSLADAVKTCTV
ncbi:MAG TPA: sugar phosphate isomerase/epimerase family protein [Bryobacteraceae bacterium]|nr:sugar phosphate isomerase/epimerase family protein [Bryobacteraceae bacterium]